MIKCPKCGADNMINAIFCRSCGDKLDFASLKIEEQLGLDDSGSKKAKASQKANQITGAVLAFVIVVLLAALLVPPTGRLACEEPTADANKLLETLKKAPEDATVSITDQDMTDLLNKMFMLPRNQGDELIKPEAISVVCYDDGTIKVVMRYSFYDFVPLHVSFTCKPQIGSSKGDVVFDEFSGFSLGWIPAFLPADVTDPFVQYFRQQVDSSKEIKAAKRNIKSIAITDSHAAFQLEKRVPKKKAAAKPAE